MIHQHIVDAGKRYAEWYHRAYTFTAWYQMRKGVA